MAGGAVFKLGSFGNFGVFKKGAVGHRSSFAKASEDRGFGGTRASPIPLRNLRILRATPRQLGPAARWGDDGNDRSFITGDFSRGRGKENGTIPF
jgi:hypothetical protein